ncbi:HD domain-containing protein [Clostridium sardiniense]|uniref:HD domain-containing protein n=1 Tax=Clostridium sardiniense TaxID=29369 RepID=A0ABS7KWP1_CLOSR|nr:HD domain-containing protein [Clostridium sardiniense]MBY0755226.1 HD domain-containing protein [Clostridium sardiniense]
MSKYYNSVREEMIKLLSKHCKEGAHDIYHLDRVYKMAKLINEKEGLSGDEDVLCLSSYMHDLHRLQMNDEVELKHSHEMGIIFYELCIKLELDMELIKKIKECIESTDKHCFLGDELESDLPIEAIILKDADNLDSLGAVGIGRAFMFGEHIGEKMYDPHTNLDGGHYNLTEKSKSIVHHFYEKLFRLEEDMGTNIGRRIAKNRIDYMEEYLNRFFEEFEVIL